jgi:hypothetical protein
LLENKAAQLAPIVPAPSKVIEGEGKVSAHRPDQFAFEHLEYGFQIMAAFQYAPIHSDNGVFALPVSQAGAFFYSINGMFSCAFEN